MRRRPTLPLVGSTIGAEMLNDRVRNGNGWDHLAVVTSSKNDWSFVVGNQVMGMGCTNKFIQAMTGAVEQIKVLKEGAGGIRDGSPMCLR